MKKWQKILMIILTILLLCVIMAAPFHVSICDDSKRMFCKTQKMFPDENNTEDYSEIILSGGITQKRAIFNIPFLFVVEIVKSGEKAFVCSDGEKIERYINYTDTDLKFITPFTHENEIFCLD